MSVIGERQVTGGIGRNPSGQKGWVSSDNQPTENLMERFKRVDSKLEKLLAIQTLQKGGGLSENLNSPEEEFSEELLRSFR